MPGPSPSPRAGMGQSVTQFNTSPVEPPVPPDPDAPVWDPDAWDAGVWADDTWQGMGA